MSSERRVRDLLGGNPRFLTTIAVLEELRGAGQASLDSLSTTITLQADETLNLEDDFTDSIYFVTSGSIHVGVPSAFRTPLKPLVAGDLFGKDALRIYMQSSMAVASELTEIIRVSISAFDSPAKTRESVRETLNQEIMKCLLRIQIASTDMFSELDDSLLSYVVQQSEFVAVERGEVIIREGDKPHCMYINVAGSLEVFKEQADGTRRTIDILRDGATVGEMAVLLNEPRSASVRAWRSSLLIKISDQCFEHVLRTDASVTLRLARTLGERLKRTTMAVSRTIAIKTIALISWCQEPYFGAFCSRLKLAFERAGSKVALLSPRGIRSGGHSAWMEAKEAACDYVLLQCPQDASEWNQSSVQQADLILFVCLPDRDNPGIQPHASIETARINGARLELALLRESDIPPEGTSAWLAVAPFEAHHHIVIDKDGSYERLVRRVSGNAVGLVLSGGGARGLAHIGVIRAIREHGLPIDMIGGTSMGAIIAAQYAVGYDPEQMLAVSRKAYLGRSQPKDFTIPFVSFRTGRATIQRLLRMFGDRRIEDLPIGYFCVSSNLSRADVVVHDSGPVWLGARVSCSIPGLLPPIPVHGDVLVDGGLLDNLPVDTMRKRLSGHVIAADVSVDVDLSVNNELQSEATWSGVSQLFRKLTRRPMLPNIVDMLMRAAELSSVRDSKVCGSPADLYLKVPVGHTAMTMFSEIDHLVAVGYEYASQRLKQWQCPPRNDLPRAIV